MADTEFNDVTGTLANPFFTTDGLKNVRVFHAGHGFSIGDKVTYSGATAFNGVDMNGTFTIVDVDTVDHYVVEAKTEANARSTGGGAAVAYNVNALNGLGDLAPTTELTINAGAGLNVSYGELGNQESFTNLFETLNIFANVQVAAGATEAQKQANQAEYRTLVDNARNVVEQAFDDINRMVADLGGDISRLNSAKETHQNEIELITKQLDDVENIDSFEAINRFQALRSQIEASYQITAASRGFSLLNFL